MKPVRLPQPYNMLFRQGFNEDYKATPAYKTDELLEALNSAGVVLEGVKVRESAPLNKRDEEFAWAFDHTNFGRTDYCQMLAEALLQRAAGYSIGHTIEQVCKDIGFLKTGQQPTKKGFEFVYNHFLGSNAQEDNVSILQRLFPGCQEGRGGKEANGLELTSEPQNCEIINSFLATKRQGIEGFRKYFLVRLDGNYILLRVCEAMISSGYAAFAVIMAEDDIAEKKFSMFKESFTE